MISVWLLVILLIVLLVYSDFINVIRGKRPPPGLKQYPLVGSYLEVRKLRNELGFYHLVWDHLTKIHGEVFSVKLGLINAVVVSGFEGVRQVMLDESFDGRPDGFVFRFRSFYKRLGIVFVDGPLWSTQRKFLMRYFKRELGGTRTEAFINEEVNDLMSEIKKKSQNGEPVQIYGLFDIAVLNSLWTMIASKRYALDDPKLIKLLELVHRSFRMIDMSGGILNQMPMVRYIAPESSGFIELGHILDEFYAFLKESVEEQSLSDQDSFIKAFLMEIEKEKESPKTFTLHQLLVTLLDLFMAGSETTSSTLAFIIYYLIKYPEVQAKIHEELDEVVGDRDVQLDDRNKLKYFEAVLMEVQRYSNVAPLAIAHRTLRNTELSGFSIPKDTVVLTSIWSVHMNKEHWGDPEVFRPGRFLDSKTGLIIKDTWFIPFGIGKRRCPGQKLAQMNMFMVIAKLLQKYELRIPKGTQLPDTPLEGVTICPAPFLAIFKSRQN